MEAGGSGVIYGRNVWQREWSEALGDRRADQGDHALQRPPHPVARGVGPPRRLTRRERVGHRWWLARCWSSLYRAAQRRRLGRPAGTTRDAIGPETADGPTSSARCRRRHGRGRPRRRRRAPSATSASTRRRRSSRARRSSASGRRRTTSTSSSSTARRCAWTSTPSAATSTAGCSPTSTSATLRQRGARAPRLRDDADDPAERPLRERFARLEQEGVGAGPRSLGRVLSPSRGRASRT